MEAIFISRGIQGESPVWALAQERGLPVFHESLVAFQPVPFSVIPPADWIFFSSPRAVTYFFRGVSKAGMLLPQKIKVGVIGWGTGKALKEFGRPADFSGHGDPNHVGTAFRQLVLEKKVLFPGARQSRRSVQRILEGGAEVIDLIVYDNRMRLDHQVPKCTFLLFTSPLNVQCWGRTHGFTGVRACVAIGKTTAAAMEAYGVFPAVASEPSEEGLVAALRQKMDAPD